MAEKTGKEEFFCYQSGVRGPITKKFCLTECKDPQRGAKGECPDSVKETMTEERIFEAFEGSSESARLVIGTYADLLAAGGIEAAQTEREDLLKDVPLEERQRVTEGMEVLLFLHLLKTRTGDESIPEN